MVMVSIKESKKGFIVAVIVISLACNKSSDALTWSLYPSLNVRETYSDNISQAHLNPEGAFVTEVSPGVSFQTSSGINSFNLNYRMQNLYNAGDHGRVNINNQLQYGSRYQLIRNLAYFDSSSTIAQQNISNRFLSGDNLTGSSNLSTVSTLNISPYITPHFGTFANAMARVTYAKVSNDNNAAIVGREDNRLFSDTDTVSENILINSGADFSKVSWLMSYNNKDSYYTDQNDIKFQDSMAEIRANLNRKLSGFVRVGQQENVFDSTTRNNNQDGNKDGFYYTVGGRWKPNYRLGFEVGIGNNSFVTVDVSPIRRLNWRTTFFKNEIGLNTGDRWQSTLTYNAPRSVWVASYDEQTTTAQEILLRHRVFNLTDPFGNVIIDPVTGQPSQAVINFPSLINEVFISKRGSVSASFATAKSVIRAEGYNEKRIYQVSQRGEDVLGINGSWIWSFAKKTSSSAHFNWQTIDGLDNTSDQRFEAAVGVTRNIYGFLNGNMEYRYLTQNSGRESVGNNGTSFTENRITLGLSMRF